MGPAGIKWSFLKFVSFCSAKGRATWLKRQPTCWKRSLPAIHTADRGWMSRVYTGFKTKHQQSKQLNLKIKNWAQRVPGRRRSNEALSALKISIFSIKETQIETTLTLHHIPGRMTKGRKIKTQNADMALGHGELHAQLVSVQTGVAPVGTTAAVPRKTRTWPSVWASHTTPGCVLTGPYFLLQRHLLIHVSWCSTHSS